MGRKRTWHSVYKDSYYTRRLIIHSLENIVYDIIIDSDEVAFLATMRYVTYEVEH